MLKAAIEAEVLIHASPEATWAVLTDFDSYPEWNPFIRASRVALTSASACGSS